MPLSDEFKEKKEFVTKYSDFRVLFGLSAIFRKKREKDCWGLNDPEWDLLSDMNRGDEKGRDLD